MRWTPSPTTSSWWALSQVLAAQAASSIVFPHSWSPLRLWVTIDECFLPSLFFAVFVTEFVRTLTKHLSHQNETKSRLNLVSMKQHYWQVRIPGYAHTIWILMTPPLCLNAFKKVINFASSSPSSGGLPTDCLSMEVTASGCNFFFCPSSFSL